NGRPRSGHRPATLRHQLPGPEALSKERQILGISHARNPFALAMKLFTLLCSGTHISAAAIAKRLRVWTVWPWLVAITLVAATYAETPSGSTPAGMVWIPGGEFSMGSDEPTFSDARPWHRVYVDGLWMDTTEVTNEQFDRFTEATYYVTVAERTPRAEDYPGAPPENLVAGSVVFSPPDRPVLLNNHYQWWSYVPGANWRHPTGPASDLTGKEHHPVVHVAY